MTHDTRRSTIEKKLSKARELSSNHRIYRVVLRMLSALKPGKLLDTPCGPGLLSHEAAKLGFDSTAADIDRSLFFLPGVNYRKIDLNRAIPLKDGSFDYLVCIEGIEHVENQFLLASEFSRLLRVGGRLIITTPNILSLSSRLYFFFTGFDSATPMPLDPSKSVSYMDHINPLTCNKLEYLLIRNGFDIERIEASHLRKGSLLIIALLYPLLLGAGIWALLRGKDPGQKKRGRNALSRALSLPVLAGGILVVQAIKK